MSAINSEDTERKPKWRLLEPGAKLQAGDRTYCPEREKILPVGDLFYGAEVFDDADMFFRRMTPAEENAEELLHSLKDLRKWIDLSAPAFISHPAYRSSEAKHISAIAKAEGVRHP